MIWLALAVLLFADPFWQTKPVTQWNDVELAQFLADSPWAQMMAQQNKPQTGRSTKPDQLVQVYFATAAPVVKALAERDRRIELRRPGTAKALADDPASEERALWIADRRQACVILAVRLGAYDEFTSGEETRRMEQDSAMDLGHGKAKLDSYFPPTRLDPHLYLAFPRGQASASDKNISFELYLPGVPGPYRSATFKVKDMLVDGKLEM
jgi:hypothetical protein